MAEITFITAGDMSFASSRIRAHWPAQYMDADVIQVSQLNGRLPDSPIIVWQKVALASLIKAYPERIHIWDNCDPSWWWEPNECCEIADLVTGATFSTDALREDFEAWCDPGIPTMTIPDRMNPAQYPFQRKHRDVSPIRFIWYGLGINRVALVAAWANLQRLVANGYKIELTIFDNNPEIPFLPLENVPVYHIKWSLENEANIISAHDIALLPPYPGPWGKLKSDNRDQTAWLCGLPVTRGEGYDHLDELVKDATYRAECIISRGDWCDISKSATDWRLFIGRLRVPFLA